MTNKFVTTVSTIYTFFGLINVYALFAYSQKIVLTDCKCSKSWERTFIYYYSMLVMSIYIFLVSLLVIAIIYSGKFRLDKNFIKDLKKTIKNK